MPARISATERGANRPTQVVGGSFKDTAGTPFTGEDIRFTAKGDALYAIALAWPLRGRLTVKSLATGSPLTKREIKAVELLGSHASLKWSRNSGGLTVELPNERPGNFPIAIRISLPSR